MNAGEREALTPEMRAVIYALKKTGRVLQYMKNERGIKDANPETAGCALEGACEVLLDADTRATPTAGRDDGELRAMTDAEMSATQFAAAPTGERDAELDRLVGIYGDIRVRYDEAIGEDMSDATLDRLEQQEAEARAAIHAYVAALRQEARDDAIRDFRKEYREALLAGCDSNGAYDAACEALTTGADHAD